MVDPSNEKNLNREEKAAVVEEIAGQIEASESIFAIDYRGISVPQAAELRAKLREADASFRVVKNRITKLAAAKAGREQLNDLLDGPTALTFVQGDMALAAKAITTLDREWEVLEFKGGLVDGEVLEVDEFRAIARLPGREALDAQLAGVVASPLTGLVRGLGSMVSGLASQLQQIAEQGLVSGEAPSASDAGSTEDSAEGTEDSAEGADPAAPGGEAEEEAGDDAPAAEASSEEAPAEEAPAEEAPSEEAPAEETPAETAEEPAPPAEQPAAQPEQDSEQTSDQTSDEPEEDKE